MRKLTITLSDEQYEWAKQWGRLWLRDVVQALMDSGYDGVVPTSLPSAKKPWWRFW